MVERPMQGEPSTSRGGNKYTPLLSLATEGDTQGTWRSSKVSMIISTWNVRGLNQPLKQKELKLFLQKHKIDPLGCLETRVKQFKSQTILNKVAHGWNSKCNYPEAVNGTNLVALEIYYTGEDFGNK
uniref:Putative ovule protein n=1 Tax=Solanum chacoense TaxID=4108 RepID=A0A0V0I3C0_SOLCH